MCFSRKIIGVNDSPLSARQWKCFIAAWLGWCFDGLDGYLYIIVAVPLVTKLLANDYGSIEAIPAGLVGSRAVLIQCFFLIGWAIGGAVFGRVGDRLGRSRTLTLTILTYATFTGLAFFATTWWQLLIDRFIAALGIGGEWAAGSALVGETLPRKHRSWASATLQSGYMVGCIMAVFTAKVFSRIEYNGKIGLEPQWVFLVGVLPAFLTLWIRRAVPESESWEKAAGTQKPPPVMSLFVGRVGRITLLTTLLTSVAMTTVWSFLYFGPQMLRKLPGIAPADQTAFVSDITVIYMVVNIVANFFATYLARWVGYRWAFCGMFAGALVVSVICFGHQYLPWAPEITKDNAALVFGLIAFFGLGLFGMFPLYVPALFPTLVRTLGAGFSYNVGRLVSAGGVLAGGWVVDHAGGYNGAIWWTGLLYLPGMAIALLMPEPPAEDLTEDLAEALPEKTGDVA